MVCPKCGSTGIIYGWRNKFCDCPRGQARRSPTQPTPQPATHHPGPPARDSIGIFSCTCDPTHYRKVAVEVIDDASDGHPLVVLAGAWKNRHSHMMCQPTVRVSLLPGRKDATIATLKAFGLLVEERAEDLKPGEPTEAQVNATWTHVLKQMERE